VVPAVPRNTSSVILAVNEEEEFPMPKNCAVEEPFKKLRE